jgi:putative peptidoglycan lipid II flippase
MGLFGRAKDSTGGPVCAQCGRTLLAGEWTQRIVGDDGQERLICSLCSGGGAAEAGQPVAISVGTRAPRPKAVRSRSDAFWQAFKDREIRIERLESQLARAEAERADLTARVAHLQRQFDGAVVEPSPPGDAYADDAAPGAALAPPAEAHVHWDGEPNVSDEDDLSATLPGRGQADAERSLAEQRAATPDAAVLVDDGVVGDADDLTDAALALLQRGVDLLNLSSVPKKIAETAAYLGEPSVHVGAEGETLVVTFLFTMAWYRYAVDIDGSGVVWLDDRGYDERHDLIANAAVHADGTVQLASTGLARAAAHPQPAPLAGAGASAAAPATMPAAVPAERFSRQKKLARAALIVAIATAASRVLGLAREMITAKYYGTALKYDVYVSLAVIPNLVSQLFADAAVAAAFVPVFTGLLTKGDHERAHDLAAKLLGFMLVVVGGVTALLLLVAPSVAHLVYPKLTQTVAMQSFAGGLLRVLLPIILLLSLSGVVNGVLYSFERFTMPAVVSVVWNAVIITTIALFHGSAAQPRVSAIAWGMLVGTAVQLLLILWATHGLDFKLGLKLDLRDPLLRKVLVLMVPITLTLGILNFNALIDTFFAQFVSGRAAAQIGYAFRLYQLPQGIFAVTIGSVLFPSLARFATLNDIGRFRETISLGTRQVLFVTLPFVVWFVALPDPIVRLIYQRGRFTGASTHEVAYALAFFAAGLVFANANIMFNRGFQSLQRPWLPLSVALVNLALNGVLDLVLYKPLGVGGITLSTSLVSLFNFAALVWLMRRQIGLVDGRRIARSALRMSGCGAALAVVSLLVWAALRGFAQEGEVRLLMALFAVIVAGAAAYLGTALLLRIDELSQLASLLRRSGRARAG